MKPPVGTYRYGEAMQLISDAIFIIASDSATTYARRHGSHDFVPMRPKEAELFLSGLFFLDSSGIAKPAFPAWVKASDVTKHFMTPVFRTSGQLQPDEFNLFGGFEVDPRGGFDDVKPFLRHLFGIVCGGSREKFHYFMKWLAHAVQHPGDNPEVMIILISEAGGAGKSLVSYALELIFGIKHASSILGDPMLLYMGFNGYTKRWICVHVEDMDDARPSEAAKLRGAITSATRRINEKNQPIVLIPNCLHGIGTSNSSAPFIAGSGARRHFALRVKEDRIGDHAYFADIRHRLERGGAGQLLRILQSVDLRGWHPRKLPRSEEVLEIQRATEKNVAIAYLEECIEAGGLLTIDTSGLVSVDYNILGKGISPTELAARCSTWAKHAGYRPITSTMLTQTLKRVLGEEFYQEKMASQDDDKRGRGWKLPSLAECRMRIDAWRDPAQRHDLQKRVKVLRQREAIEEAEREARDAKAANHQANRWEAAFIAAWPQNQLSKHLDFEGITKLAAEHDPLRIALWDIGAEFVAEYGKVPTPDEIRRVVFAFDGASDQRVGRHCTVNPLKKGKMTVNANIIVQLKPAPSSYAPGIGKRLLADGRVWDVVLGRFLPDREEGNTRKEGRTQ